MFTLLLLLDFQSMNVNIGQVEANTDKCTLFLHSTHYKISLCFSGIFTLIMLDCRAVARK